MTDNPELISLEEAAAEILLQQRNEALDRLELQDNVVRLTRIYLRTRTPFTLRSLRLALDELDKNIRSEEDTHPWVPDPG